MVKKDIELLCIGNALIDVFANGEEGTNYGLTQPVQHIEMKKMEKILPTLPDHVMVSGGGAANVAKIAGNLGAKVAFTGAIGTDRFGQLFAEELRAAAVKLRLAEKPLPTGLCLVLRTGDKTQIAASPSASFELSEKDMNEADIKAAKVVMIDGYILDRPGLVKHILALADKHGTVAAIDLGSTAIAREHATEIAAYTEEYPLILFMNEEEFRAFCDALTSNKKPKEYYFYYFLRILYSSERKNNRKIEKPQTRDPIQVIKLKENGVVCIAGGTVYPSKTETITPLESTGSGDAFCAGFLTAWVRGKPIPKCAAMGNKAAGIMLNVMGTQITDQAKKSLNVLLH